MVEIRYPLVTKNPVYHLQEDESSAVDIESIWQIHLKHINRVLQSIIKALQKVKYDEREMKGTCHNTGERAAATGAGGADGVWVLMIYCSGAAYL